MKIYGLINGIFYVLYGLYGVIAPKHLAANVMGWTPDLLGLHQIRAMWMASVGAGIICIIMALKGKLAPLTQAIVLLTLCFMVGRIFGLIMDGTGPTQTYTEIAIEIVWAVIGLILLAREKAKDSEAFGNFS